MIFIQKGIDKSFMACYNIYIKEREGTTMTMKEIEMATMVVKMRMEGKTDLEILMFIHNKEG